MKAILQVSAALVLVFLCKTASAQWTQVDGPDGGMVTSFESLDSFVYAGTFGGVFRSSDAGAHWNESWSASLPTQVNDLIVLGRTLLAATAYGPYRSTDYGQHWVAPDSSILGIPFSSVANCNGVLYGAGTLDLYQSNDTGSSWTPIGIPKRYTSPSRAFVLDGRVFVTTAMGLVRKVQASVGWEYVHYGLPYTEVFCLASIGHLLFAATGAGGCGLYYSDDYGDTWSPTTSDLKFHTFCVFSQDSILFRSNGVAIESSRDSGKTWTLVGQKLGPIGVQSARVLGSDLFVALGSIGHSYHGWAGAYKSADHGNTWTNINHGLKGLGVSVLTATDGVLFVGANGGLWRSSDLGTTWSGVCKGSEGRRFVSLDVGGGYVFGATDGHGLYRSSDKGITWDSIDYGLTDSFITVVFVHDSIAYAGSPVKGLFRSADYGIHWSSLSVGNQLSYLSAMTGCGQRILLGALGLYESSDQGQSWTNPSIPLFSGSVRLVFGVHGNRVAMGSSGSPGLFTSFDAGQSWTPHDLNLRPNSVSCVLLLGDTILVGTDNHGVRVSHDFGNSWDDFSAGLSDSAITQIVRVGSRLFIGTRTQGLWKRSLDDLGVNATQTYNSSQILTAIPNPCRGSGVLNYSLNRPGSVNIRLFDQLGKLVTTLIDDTESIGEHTVAFDVSDLPMGTYIVLFQSNQGALTRTISIVH